jgi:hypothetical protein
LDWSTDSCFTDAVWLVGFFHRLLLGLASCLVGRDLSLLRGSQLIQLSARKVRIKSGGVIG